MKATFVFDTIIMKCGENYYARTLHYELWEKRYIPAFNEISVCTRVKEVEESVIKSQPMLKLVNGPKINVVPVKEYRNIPDALIRNRIIKEKLYSLISKSDLVIVRVPSMLGFFAADICSKLNKPFFLEVVADPWDGYFNHQHWAGKIIAPYMYLKNKIVCANAPFVLYVTDNFLQSRYPNKRGHSVGVSDVILPERDNFTLQRRLLKITNKKKIIKLGMVGNYDLKSKGHIVALKALRLILNEYSTDVVLEVVGAGDDTKLKKKIRNLNIEDNVYLRGTIPSGNDMFNWLDSIDIFLIPSFQEGLPRILIEAFSRGCPSVGSNAGGIPELINKKYLHDKGDYKKFANDVSYLMQSDLEMLKVAKSNFEVSKRYEEDVLNKKREFFYKLVKEDIDDK